MSTIDEMYTSKSADKKREHIYLQSVLHTAKLSENSIWGEMVEALNFWFKLPNDKLEKIKHITRLIQVTHNTIVDVSENAVLRNGQPTANSVYSVADALNGAYYCCFIILERLRDLENFEAMKIGNEFFLDSSKGYGMETYYRDNIICPTENEYLKVAILKTGSVLRLTIKLMQMFSGNRNDFSKLTDIFAKFFHISDDYLGLYSLDGYLLNKNGLDNLHEGKFSFPIVHGIRTKPDDLQLISMLRQKPTDPEVLKYFVTLMEKFGSIDYTKQFLKQLKEEAEEEIKVIGENPLIKQILENICYKLETK